MNREIDTSNFQRELNRVIPRTAVTIVQTVVFFSDGSQVITHDDGTIQRVPPKHVVMNNE